MSARGFGGIVRTSAAAIGGVAGAQNGLSLNGADVELGGSLIINTAIDLNGSVFEITDSSRTQKLLELDPSANRYVYGILNVGGGPDINAWSFEADSSILYAGSLSEALKVTQSTQLYQFGDILTGNNGLFLELFDQQEAFQIRSNTGAMLSGSNITLDFGFGDLAASGNGSSILILDSSNQLIISNGVGTLNMGPTNAALASGPGARLDVNSGSSEIQFTNNATNVRLRINNILGFTGTVTPVNSITVEGGIVTSVT
jgi:hypothetical protein